MCVACTGEVERMEAYGMDGLLAEGGDPSARSVAIATAIAQA